MLCGLLGRYFDIYIPLLTRRPSLTSSLQWEHETSSNTDVKYWWKGQHIFVWHVVIHSIACGSTYIHVISQAGKLRKMKHEQQKESDGLGVNIRSIVIVAVLMLLMMFAVHCTWVTSNAYSSPSIVLASYSHDGWENFQYVYFLKVLLVILLLLFSVNLLYRLLTLHVPILCPFSFPLVCTKNSSRSGVICNIL